MPTPPYQEHVLGAADVCSNCFRLIRVERVDPTRSGMGVEYETTFQRRRRTTSVEYAPHEEAKEHKGVFCECGVESARHRIWSAEDIDMDRFEELTQNLLATLAAKDVSLKQKEAAMYALQKFRDGGGPDQALATGVEAGIVANVAES